jgi:hypothetical protein
MPEQHDARGSKDRDETHYFWLLLALMAINFSQQSIDFSEAVTLAKGFRPLGTWLMKLTSELRRLSRGTPSNCCSTLAAWSPFILTHWDFSFKLSLRQVVSIETIEIC